MKLEGRAKIELTNVRTGEKERVEEKNLVTNALSTIFGYNYLGKYETSGLYGKLIPVYKKALGGILLFDGAISEDPNTIIPPGNVMCIGHAGNSPYSGQNNYRGGLNEYESEELSDGIKLVWDFATQQANGTIRCLSMTSERGGVVGLGNSEKRATDIPEPYYEIRRIDYHYIPVVYQTMDYDFEFTVPNNNTILIKKYSYPKSGIRITSDITRKKLITEHSLALTESMRSGAINSIDMEDGIIYIIYEYGAVANKQCVLKVSVDDMSLLNTYTFPNYDLYNRGVVLDNYLYAARSDNTKKLMKINLLNTADAKEIDLKGEDGTRVCRYGNYIYTELFRNSMIIDKNDNVMYTYSNWSNGNRYYRHIDKLFYNYYYSPSSYEDIMMTVLYPFYLATINNLATPVVKTADKTMKITYTIREVT